MGRIHGIRNNGEQHRSGYFLTASYQDEERREPDETDGHAVM